MLQGHLRRDGRVTAAAAATDAAETEALPSSLGLSSSRSSRSPSASSQDTEGGANRTLVGAEPAETETRTRRAPASVRSSQRSMKTKRRQEMEARLELARREMEEAKAAAAFAKAQLDLLTLEEDDDIVTGVPGDQLEKTEDWVKSTVDKAECLKKTAPGEGCMRRKSGEGLLQGVSSDAAVKPEEPLDGTKTLADAILKAINNVPKNVAAPPGYMHELPFFDGNCGEWLAFKTVYEDTSPLFSGAQNMARLRKAIKGTAREAIKSLLYSECLPDEVMESLRRRFGRPDALVLVELEKLRSLPRITDNARDVCVFASQVNNTVATIWGLKKPHYLHSPEMMKIIVEKMPAVLKYRWFDFAAEKEDADLPLLAKFLNREADRCSPYATQEPVTRRQQPVARQAAHTATTAAEKTTCPHCQEDHHLFGCRKFQQASKKDRWEIVIKSKVCFKCLQGRHRKERCRKPPCKFCGRWHHQLLHDDRPAEQTAEDKKEVANNVRPTVNATKTSRAYLKMVPVELYGPKGTARVLALLDEGSTVTLLDSSVVDQIGARGPREALSLETVGGKIITNKDSMKINMKIRGIHQSAKRNIIGARTIDNLRLTPQKMEKKRIEECAHLFKLADQLWHEEEPPKLLIGQDNWELIVSRSTRKGKTNDPVASFTHLGWVLHGCDGGASRPVNFVTCAHTSMTTREEDMEQLIKDHFAIESLGVQPRRPSTDAEGKALQILQKTTRRLEDGRFETGLLWKDEQENMPDNYESAKNRLRGIEKKLDKDGELKQEYQKQIQNLLDNGYAEEAPLEPTPGRTWYLPHFAVTHPTKRKKRLVFDAAAKFAGKSLNDRLLPGPDLLQSLFGVLLRFRQRPIAVVADIKEMFLQVKIRAEDRDSLRFLWRGDQRTENPRAYRMTSVIFGAACSPSSAIYVKNTNAAAFKEEFPEATLAVERNHYMDDYLHSFQTEGEAIRIAGEVDAIHRKAGFELRGWASNRPGVARKLARGGIESKEVELGSKEEKTLGLRWFTEKDEMGFRSSLRNLPEDVANLKRTPTKREVTSAVMSTFDPMGLASPVLIQGKKLLQDIWRSGVGWDEEVAPEEEASWGDYLKSLQLLRDLRIPRCIARTSTEGELHVFTDASEVAYSCAVYWRQSHGRQHDVALLAGKARVTPLKPVSIPRLELQAALLGTRLARSVEEELDIKPTKKIYWTDSSTVLSWIKSDPRTFKPFVAHRLAEIEDTSKPQEWRWVPTAHNPADDATRAIPKEFNGSHRWYTGPAFLKEDEDHWPRPRSFKAEATGEEKEKPTVAAARLVTKFQTPDPSRFSSWERLLRATARVLQFIDLCRKKLAVNLSRRLEKQDPTWKNSTNAEKRTKPVRVNLKERRWKPLDRSHLEAAEKLLLRRSQEESFGEEIACLKKAKTFDRASKLKKLDVIEEESLLRIKGRIDAATDLRSSFRRPVVLDSKHHLTRLIIKHLHEAFNHGNHATVINEVRQRFWILGLRSAVRATAHQCQWCKVYRGKPHIPPPGDLPKERLRFGEPPFSSSAVDYFGPMTVTVGRRHEKRWGALFTCMTTRAVHIELAASLSADSMILALRRMAARRGTPKTMFSDNGTNFVRADKELQEAIEELKTEDVTREAEKMGVRWKFIPPGAPNMGGAWERLVRSIKTALAVTLRERHPKEEVLHTLLLEAEHVVNARPLISGDFTGEEALTPNHFLIGRSCGAPRMGAFTDEDLSGRRTWRTAQRLADHFWARWVKEYLPTLIPRRIDGGVATRDLQFGDVVLIADSTLPRNSWPRGEIVTTYPGPDGRTRIVEVRTTGETLKRPSSKVVLLVPANERRIDQQRADENEVVETAVGAKHEGEDVDDPRPLDKDGPTAR